MREVISKGLRIIYCDETVFTKRTYATKDYAGKHQIIEVDEAKIYAPYVCALAAVSAESPIELVRTFTQAVNIGIFKSFIQALSAKHKSQPFALFMDNLAVHKSDEVKQELRRLRITPIFNAPYSPQFNPIEGCFSIVKNHFKSQKLNSIKNGKHFSF